MKKRGKYTYVKILIYVVWCVTFVSTIISCGRKDTTSPMIITISDSNNVVPSELFIEKIDSIIIPNNELCYMSIIEDVYVGDSSIYALDTSANLIKINLFLRSGRESQVFAGAFRIRMCYAKGNYKS